MPHGPCWRSSRAEGRSCCSRHWNSSARAHASHSLQHHTSPWQWWPPRPLHHIHPMALPVGGAMGEKTVHQQRASPPRLCHRHRTPHPIKTAAATAMTAAPLGSRPCESIPQRRGLPRALPTGPSRELRAPPATRPWQAPSEPKYRPRPKQHTRQKRCASKGMGMNSSTNTNCSKSMRETHP